MRNWRMVALLIAAPLVAVAAPQPKNEWKQCRQDSDCVAIKGVCRPATVNGVFKADAERYYAIQAENTRCPSEFWHPPTPIPRCRLNSCEMVQKDSD